MKNILLRIKTVLIRGILFAGPVLVFLIIIEKVIEKFKQITTPIADLLPFHSLIGLDKAYWAPLIILLLIGLLMGLIARMKIAVRFLNWLEGNFLNRIPGYFFMKQMGESAIGVDDTKIYQVVLLSIEEAWQLAYLVEEIDERFVAVYVPGVPSPLDGNLFYVSKTRIKETTISYKESIELIHRQGKGSSKFLKGVL